jgi:hypothetical protein
MRTSLTIAGVLVGTGIILASTTLPALADSNNVSGIVSGGTLTATTSDITLSDVILEGQTVQHATGSPVTPWTITDARGSSAAWALTVEATEFTSAAGLVDVTARTIPIVNLTITPGTITAGTGSDSATSSTAITLSDTPQTMIAVLSAGKGSYSFTPNFDLAVPANTFRSNFSDGIGESPVNPYVSVVTYTVA